MTQRTNLSSVDSPDNWAIAHPAIQCPHAWMGANALAVRFQSVANLFEQVVAQWPPHDIKINTLETQLRMKATVVDLVSLTIAVEALHAEIGKTYRSDFRNLESCSSPDKEELRAVVRTRKAYTQQLNKVQHLLTRVRHNIGAHQSPIGAESSKSCGWGDLRSLWATNIKEFSGLMKSIDAYVEAANRLSAYEWFREAEDGCFEFIRPLVFVERSSD